MRLLPDSGTSSLAVPPTERNCQCVGGWEDSEGSCPCHIGGVNLQTWLSNLAAGEKKQQVTAGWRTC